jgi:hypothetical protein
VDVLDRAALGGDAATPELQVEVLDVEGQELLGAGGGLVGPVLGCVTPAAK